VFPPSSGRTCNDSTYLPCCTASHSIARDINIMACRHSDVDCGRYHVTAPQTSTFPLQQLQKNSVLYAARSKMLQTGQVRRSRLKPSARGYIWATLSLGDINTGYLALQVGGVSRIGTIKYGLESRGTALARTSKQTKTPWSESASELYRPSDCRLSAK
jgi:hypothetical protein